MFANNAISEEYRIIALNVDSVNNELYTEDNRGNRFSCALSTISSTSVSSVTNMTITSALSVDSINEATSNNGVRIDGCHVRDGSVILSEAVELSAATSSSVYQLVFPATQGAAETVLKNDGSGNLSWVAQDVATSTISVDVIEEKYINSGVTIDSVLLRDGGVSLKGGNSFVQLSADATTADYSITLPNVQGASGSMLENDGSGNLSWTTSIGTIYSEGSGITIDASNAISVDTSVLFSSIGSNMIPSTNNTYDLGSSSKSWRHVYISSNSIWIGNAGKMMLRDGAFAVITRDVTRVPQYILTNSPSFTEAQHTSRANILDGATNSTRTLGQWETYVNTDVSSGGAGVTAISPSVNDIFDQEFENVNPVVPGAQALKDASVSNGGGNSVVLKPAAGTESYDITLPPDAPGNTHKILVTDANSHLQWANDYTVGNGLSLDANNVLAIQDTITSNHTFSGSITFSNNLTVQDPTLSTHAVNKSYIDNIINVSLNTAGTAYVFNGKGLTNDENPTFFVSKGETYFFVVDTPGENFCIKTSYSTGATSLYTDGITNNNITSGTLTFVVPQHAPFRLYYQSSVTSTLQGEIQSWSGYIVIPGEIEGYFLTANTITTTQTLLTGNEGLVSLATDQTLTGNKTFTGTVIVPTPTLSTHAVTKEYVDTSAVLLTTNQTVAGTKTFSSSVVNSVVPTNAAHLTNKDYVDTLVATKASLTDNQTFTGDQTIEGEVLLRDKLTTNNSEFELIGGNFILSASTPATLNGQVAFSSTANITVNSSSTISGLSRLAYAIEGALGSFTFHNSQDLLIPLSSLQTISNVGGTSGNIDVSLNEQDPQGIRSSNSLTVPKSGFYSVAIQVVHPDDSANDRTNVFQTGMKVGSNSIIYGLRDNVAELPDTAIYNATKYLSQNDNVSFYFRGQPGSSVTNQIFIVNISLIQH